MPHARRRHAPGSPRPLIVWVRIRDSLWFIPTLSAAVGAGLAALALTLPAAGRLEDHLEGAWIYRLIFSGEVGSARAILSTIAGSLITVTGVVFSVTMVTLQLASTQFTPRVMRSFIADRPNQFVLGVFIGTFIYTLLVLGSLGSPAFGDDGVPGIAVTGSIVLLLVSVGALILFIDRTARSAQVSLILRRESKEGLAHIRSMFPAGVGTGVSPDSFHRPAGAPGRVPGVAGGYIQAIDGQGLLELAERHGLLIEMRVGIGAFVFDGKVLFHVWPREALTDEIADELREACILGPERTPQQDVEFSIGAVSDIALRALSTGINDPSTALLALDRLTQMLAALIGSEESPLRASESGTPRLLLRTTTFERAAGLAFDQLRVNGAGNPSVADAMLRSLKDLISLAGSHERDCLLRHAEMIMATARAECKAHELPAVEETARTILG